MPPIEYSKLSILEHPHAALREMAKPVERFDEDLQLLIARMIEVLQTVDGVGLAATQLGVPLRVFVTTLPGLESRWYVNPVLMHPKGEDVWEEGCLSIPGKKLSIRRAKVVTIRYMDVAGRAAEEVSGGLPARCWQHEVDHLDGILIIDKELRQGPP